jgi:hypothetical protein
MAGGWSDGSKTCTLRPKREQGKAVAEGIRRCFVVLAAPVEASTTEGSTGQEGSRRTSRQEVQENRGRHAQAKHKGKSGRWMSDSR